LEGKHSTKLKQKIMDSKTKVRWLFQAAGLREVACLPK